MRGIVRRNVSVRSSTILTTAFLCCGPLAVEQAASSSAATAASNWKEVEDCHGPSGPNAAR